MSIPKLVPKMSFVMIREGQVEDAETIIGHQDAIARRIGKIQDHGFDSAVAIFGDSKKWDISFPLTDAEIEATATKLHRSL